MTHHVRRIDDPVQRKRPDRRWRRHDTMDAPKNSSAWGFSRLLRADPMHRTAADEIDFGAGLMQQDRALASTLPSPDNGDTFALEDIEAGVFGRMTHELRREAVELGRSVFLVAQAHGDDHALLNGQNPHPPTGGEIRCPWLRHAPLFGGRDRRDAGLEPLAVANQTRPTEIARSAANPFPRYTLPAKASSRDPGCARRATASEASCPWACFGAKSPSVRRKLAWLFWPPARCAATPSP